MSTLMLVPPGNEHPRKEGVVLSDAEKLQALRREVNSAIEDRLEKLRGECETMRQNMESLLFRIDAQGFDIELRDIKTATWYRTATEVKLLQQVREFIASLD